jgi:hypothetical protein
MMDAMPSAKRKGETVREKQKHDMVVTLYIF